MDQGWKRRLFDLDLRVWQNDGRWNTEITTGNGMVCQTIGEYTDLRTAMMEICSEASARGSRWRKESSLIPWDDAAGWQPYIYPTLG
jgi:hypothetical protein